MRAHEKLMSAKLKEPRRMPRFLNSMPNAMVAAACRKISTPPVTSSWLMGGVSSTGRITRKCRTAPQIATSTMPSRAARMNGRPPL
jgi:hypothetical protein